MTTCNAAYEPDFDLGDFRYAVARYVKLLIRARWKCEPGFLSDEELQTWGLGEIAEDRLAGWRLLEDAAAALARLNTEFLTLLADPHHGFDVSRVFTAS